MAERKIFKKQKKLQKRYLFLLIFISFFLILFFFYPKKTYFEIPEFSGSFYYIPEDKGGVKVSNFDKKSLYPDFKDNSDIKINNDPMLEYSILLFASNNYNLVKKKINLMVAQKNNNNEFLFNENNLFIVVFNNNLGNEYLLLFKNFTSRNIAKEYCLKYLDSLQNCLIVNVQNLY